MVKNDSYKGFETFLWAKKSDKDGVSKWLPLKQHLIDTMNIAGLLWEHWISKNQKRLIINSLSVKNEETAKALVTFLAGIHDIGKATPAFQIKKSRYSNSRDLDNLLIEKLDKAGFNGICNLFLSSGKSTPHALASEVILNKYGVKEDIASIVGGHHGKPVDESLLVDQQIEAFTVNYYQFENDQNPIYLKWENTQRDILCWALNECGFTSLEDLPSIALPAQVILSGILIMADWIASNENYFSLISLDEDGESINQKDRIIRGWKAWFKTFSWNPIEQFEINELYRKRFGFIPNKVQTQLYDIIKNTKTPGLFIIEAPMGLGKTEAALIASEQLSAKFGLSGVFFGLPTQATSNGIFARVKNWLDSLAKEELETKSIQLVHGKASLNDDYYTMANNIDIDGDSDSNIIINKWFSGNKTAILDDFVVGTVDHFLLSVLKQKHLSLRHMGFSKKVVVIDEVHAYDAYMGQYINNALAWMGAYKVPVIILSATLPSETRSNIIKAYISGTGNKLREVTKPDNWGSIEAYPIISVFDGNEVKQFADFNISHDKTIEISKIKDEDLIEILEDKLFEGGIAGIIVNTIKRAQAIAISLSSYFGDDTVDILHSGFISTHRVEKEKKLIETIGKNASRPYKRIIIGTQVIEQSLDIDFDILFSDLSPMDLLLQRTGRLHRHIIDNRPQRLKHPQLYIMGSSEDFEFEKGSIAVYGNCLLIRTQYYLPKTISIPEDISTLVQAVYKIDDTELEQSLNEDLKIKYNQSKATMIDIIEKKKAKASAFLLDKPKKSKMSLIAWLKNNLPKDISDEKGFAQVRDGGENIEVICVKKFDGGYSFFNEKEDISNKIDNMQIGKKLANQSLRLPNILSSVYNIDKSIDMLEKENREKFLNWQQQPWLKGSLGIIFDENNNYILNDWQLHYDEKYGLKYEKVENNGKV